MLQLPSLRNLCLWWLMTNLNPSSCLGTFVLALLRLHLDLAETAKLYAIEHFREVMEGEEWLQLSPDHLTIFLDEPYLGCDNDGQLLKVKFLNPKILTYFDSKSVSNLSPIKIMEPILRILYCFHLLLNYQNSRRRFCKSSHL